MKYFILAFVLTILIGNVIMALTGSLFNLFVSIFMAIACWPYFVNMYEEIVNAIQNRKG